MCRFWRKRQVILEGTASLARTPGREAVSAYDIALIVVFAFAFVYEWLIVVATMLQGPIIHSEAKYPSSRLMYRSV